MEQNAFQDHGAIAPDFLDWLAVKLFLGAAIRRAQGTQKGSAQESG